ncbi:nuclear transport factor 2 family protein [Nocardia sp. NPDC051900]|uniref:nuclear transport factor 2 family protein n=1 Tax=Nocardia sp. NPDC051900 TaxID=3364326 RepID=UPI0037B7B449
MTGATMTAASIATAIRELEDRRYAAVLTGEFDRFAALAHPDLVYTHSTAEVDTRDSYLEKLRTGHYRYHRIDHPVTRVVVAADTAIVVGEMHAEITAAGVRKTLANRVLAVWVYENDEWLLLAFQPTVIPAGERR